MNRLKPAAVALLSRLPCTVRNCESDYGVALALSLEEGMVTLTGRTVLGNGQIRYLVRKSVTDEKFSLLQQAAAEAGDLDMVAVCDEALRGEAWAIERCDAVIGDGEAQE